MPIYNCHTHIFTIDNVPNGFLPFGLARLMKLKLLRWPARLLLVHANPLSNRDLFHRYSNFIKISYEISEKNVFERLKKYYPSDAKFIILPMDMAYMGAGKVKEDFEKQHRDLAELSRQEEYAGRIIPFVAVDPRRDGILDMLKKLVEEEGFKGIKIYPRLGYKPDDERLYDVYKYAEEKSIPIMTHCSKGGVYSKNLPKEETISNGDPDNYIKIMKDFPNLRICLAHFGGDKDWQDYLDNPRDADDSREETNWVRKILNIMRSRDYTNLYADISYTIFRFGENSMVLKVLLSDSKIRSQVLFGSDFYMVEQEEFMEKRLSIYLRATLGEKLFEQIAETNPKNYLFGISDEDQV